MGLMQGKVVQINHIGVINDRFLPLVPPAIILNFRQISELAEYFLIKAQVHELAVRLVFQGTYQVLP